ncbi:hypothetical protein RKD29_007249 [Streptomyces tendae]
MPSRSRARQPRDQPGHMHLGDTEALADVLLGEFLDEPPVDDLPVAFVQLGDHRGQGVEVVHQPQGGVVGADEVRERRLAVLAAVDGRVQGGGVVAVGRQPGLDDLVLREAHQLRKLLGGGVAAQPAAQLLGGAGQLDAGLLETPGHVHRPRGVPEEPLDLPDDVRHGEGGELDLAGQLEPVDGLDQTDHADLDDVLHLLRAAAAEPAGREADQGHVHLDQRVAGVLVLGSALLQHRQLLEEQLRQLPRVPGRHLGRVRDLRHVRRGVLGGLCGRRRHDVPSRWIGRRCHLVGRRPIAYPGSGRAHMATCHGIGEEALTVRQKPR